MGFAVGKEYCASPADYVRCSLDQEDMSRNRDGPDTVVSRPPPFLSCLFIRVLRAGPLDTSSRHIAFLSVITCIVS